MTDQENNLEGDGEKTILPPQEQALEGAGVLSPEQAKDEVEKLLALRRAEAVQADADAEQLAATRKRLGLGVEKNSAKEKEPQIEPAVITQRLRNLEFHSEDAHDFALLLAGEVERRGLATTRAGLALLANTLKTSIDRSKLLWAQSSLSDMLDNAVGKVDQAEADHQEVEPVPPQETKQEPKKGFLRGLFGRGK